MTTTETTFSTYDSRKQAQIVHDLMDLFRSNQRGYGLGEFEGAKFNEDKNKWIPGHVRWTWGITGEDQWRDHLSGVRLLGQGVLCDDNKVWYACLDIDVYNIDYLEEMQRIRKSGLPLVVSRTKSGGLRIKVLFTEAIEAELVISRMRRIASTLGYAGCEIFPKQAMLDISRDDCPSWIYMPFGGTNEIFAEQGCMTDNGNLMELADAVAHMKDMRVSKSKFMEMFAAEETAKTNGKTNGKKHPKGAWVEEETPQITINTMFHDGPICLWQIAQRRCRDMQNNFLINVSIFLERKYPENWDKALEWVNYNVLQPVGDREKLNDMIKRRKEHGYYYKCGDEPIKSYCHAQACRRMPYGVGSTEHTVDHYELGITIIMREPRLYIINPSGMPTDRRMELKSDELWNLHKYQIKCLDYGIIPPQNIKQNGWTDLVTKGIANGTEVEPSHIMRTNAAEIELLTKWLSVHIPTFMRQGERVLDSARVRVEERKIYFKWLKLQTSWAIPNDLTRERMRTFVETKCENHKEGRGLRGWWRYTHSIPFDMFDEEIIEQWLAADTDKGDGNGTTNRATEGNEQNAKTDR
jgi:hypothetical protein